MIITQTQQILVFTDYIMRDDLCVIPTSHSLFKDILKEDFIINFCERVADAQQIVVLCVAEHYIFDYGAKNTHNYILIVICK